MSSDFSRRLVRTPALYRQTLSYVSAIVVGGLVADGVLPFPYGVALLGLVSVLLTLSAMHRDLAVALSIHDALLSRIDTLMDALAAAGVSVPDDPEAGSDVR